VGEGDRVQSWGAKGGEGGRKKRGGILHHPEGDQGGGGTRHMKCIERGFQPKRGGVQTSKEKL